MRERSQCYTCHQNIPADHLDSKPLPTLWLAVISLLMGQRYMLRYAADHGYDFDYNECKGCYGAGWKQL